MNKIIFILGCAVLMAGVMLSAPHYPPVPRPVMVNPNGTLATSDTNFFLLNTNWWLSLVPQSSINESNVTIRGVDINHLPAILAGTNLTYYVFGTPGTPYFLDGGSWRVDGHGFWSGPGIIGSRDSQTVLDLESVVGGADFIVGNKDGNQVVLLDSSGRLFCNISQSTNSAGQQPLFVNPGATTNLVIPSFGTLVFSNGLLQGVTP